MFDTRNAQIQWATWLLENKAKGIGYTEGPARMSDIGIWPPKFPLAFDCSAFCTYVAWLANGNDPNGLNFDHEGYTGTFLTNLLHVTHDIIPGDYVVYGPGTGEHVAFIVEVHGPDILTISMGEQGDPSYVWVNPPTTVPSRGYPSDGRQPQTFLANHTDSVKKPRTPQDLHPVRKIVKAPVTAVNNSISKIINWTRSLFK